MEPVTLKALFHRRMECIGIFYARETSLEKIIRRQPNVKWSKTYACWYIPLTAEAYQILMRDLGGKATVDNRALRTYLEQRKQPASTIPEKHPAIAKTPRPAPTGIDKAAMKLSAENTEALRKFVELLKLKGYSVSTIRTYRNEFTQLLQLLNLKPVAELTADELKRYMAFIMDKQGLSENTAHSRLNALKFYFEQVLGREKFFYEIPRPKKWKKLPKVISEEKILEGLLKVQNLKHKTLLLLAYSAGMRVSEVIQLKITDIDSDRMQVRINHAKGKKDRVVTLSSGLLPILRDYYVAYKPKSWLFEGQYHGEHISSRTAQTVFKEAYKNLGLPPQCSFHSLRHSYATHLLESGTDISYIQKLLGHQDIKTTLIYTQVSNKEIGKIESPLDRALRKKGK